VAADVRAVRLGDLLIELDLLKNCVLPEKHETCSWIKPSCAVMLRS